MERMLAMHWSPIQYLFIYLFYMWADVQSIRNTTSIKSITMEVCILLSTTRNTIRYLDIAPLCKDEKKINESICLSKRNHSTIAVTVWKPRWITIINDTCIIHCTGTCVPRKCISLWTPEIDNDTNRQHNRHTSNNFGIFVERQIYAVYVCELEIACGILCFAIAVVIFRVSNAHCSWHSWIAQIK